MKFTEKTFGVGKWFFVCMFLLVGCAPFSPALKKSSLASFEGQRAYNRVALRVWEGNEIWFTNFYHIGEFIPVGTECTITKIAKGSIKFIALGKKYKLKGWLVDNDVKNIELSFDKYFVKDRRQIGLENIDPDLLASIMRGVDKVGMTKEEVLMCVGYPSHLGIKDHTMQYTREYILEKDEWFYMQSRLGRVTLIFEEGKLVR
jgi:hypothetical protein